MDRKPNYLVRKAREQDIKVIVEDLAKRMVEEEYGRPELYNKDTFYNIANIAVTQGVCFVVDKEGVLVGVLLGVVGPHPFNPQISVLTELVWYVNPEDRATRAAALLIKRYIKEGERVADEMTFSLLPTSPIKDSTMSKLGFVMKERGYLKRK